MTLPKSPKYLNWTKKAQHDPKVRLQLKAELGWNQKENHEKFSLSLTVIPAQAELGLAQLKLVTLSLKPIKIKHLLCGQICFL